MCCSALSCRQDLIVRLRLWTYGLLCGVHCAQPASHVYRQHEGDADSPLPDASLLSRARISSEHGAATRMAYLEQRRVKESASQADITTAYRKLARQWHPDKNNERREEAELQFSAIANAYDILRNAQSRADYDYALAHPEQFAYNHARYYYRQYYVKHMKMNPILVLLVALVGWSAFDYTARLLSYKQAIRVFKESREYKLALKRLREETLLELEREGKIKKKLNGKRTRKEIDAVQVDEQELVDRIQVHGSYRKPQVVELAIVQIWLLPYYLVKAVAWQARWILRYNIRGQEYTEEDKEYIVRGILNMSVSTWDALEERTKDKIMARELWIKENEAQYRSNMRKASIAARCADEDGFD